MLGFLEDDECQIFILELVGHTNTGTLSLLRNAFGDDGFFLESWRVSRYDKTLKLAVYHLHDVNYPIEQLV